jgi:hypothetical protein
MKISSTLAQAIFFLTFLCSSGFSIASDNIDRQITVGFELSQTSSNAPRPDQRIWATKFNVYTVDFEQLKQQLNGSDIAHRNDLSIENNVFIQLPNTSGSFDTYRVLRNSTMHPELAAAYPEIRTFDVLGVSDRNKSGKIDITPHGFHAMIFDRQHGTFFIDPIQMANTSEYMVYHKNDFVTSKAMSCFHEEHAASLLDDIVDNGDDIALSYASCALRTYRLALAATGEYTIYHGGTVALALAAQVTTMNRVNGVYEREIAITMTIIANNNLIIYTNPSTDPYTNGNASAMLGENQTTLGTVIGSANYDIGHVFGTNSGGVAGLGVVCNSTNNNKARGVTGSSAPIGDPFDIDYVAHEIGHQFGANHTQNNPCNSVNGARFEPGSASTIMGYAGICAPNVQNNSDDYFHTRSLQEMGNFISGGGHNCPVITTSGNSAPIITGTNGGVSLPVSTPFALTATATDANSGNTLVYRWEQYNNEASTQPPVSTSTGGPNFRSWTSTTTPTRYFPRLQALANNGPFTWEVLPSVTRTMAFRVTVHDDHTVGGCSDYVTTTVNFDATAGPFVLTYPSATNIFWASNSTETVTWNVANTNNTAVNCQFVNIFLSTNGGLDYPIVLATNVPNTGSASVSVPNLPNTTSRVMVMASNGTFFDISDNNFTITDSSVEFNVVPVNSGFSVCQGGDATYTINVSPSGNFSGTVSMVVNGLPAGAVATWSANPISVPNTTVLTIATTDIVPGTYQFSVTSTGTDYETTNSFVLGVNPNIADATFTQVGQSLIATQTFAQHQWLDCSTNPPSPIAGATGASYTMTTATGSYALQATAVGCVAVSECVNINMVNVESFGLNSVQVYPNPANQTLFVSWDSNEIQLDEIKLYDASGKLVRIAPAAQEFAEIDIVELSSGMYYLELRSKDQIQHFKVVKN